MQIISNKINNTYFKSNNHIKPEENIDDPYFQNCRNVLRDHYYEYELPYHRIYENEGRMTDYQLGNMMSQLINIPKYTNDNDILSLPLANIKKIGEHSYRGQTLYDAEEKYFETVKNAGVDTVVDLIGYPDYDTQVKDAGMNYFCFKSKEVYNSPAFDSLKKHLNEHERLYLMAKNEGIDINVDEYLKHDKEIFLTNTRKDINNFIDFINVMRKDNVYIGCQYGTEDTSLALMLNDAFNPKCQEKPLEISGSFKITKVNQMFNLYYNLSPDDKRRMGWTEETNDKVFDRLMDCYTKLINPQN